MKSEKPSQFENQPSKERSSEYVKTLAELGHIMNTPEKEQRRYVEKRLANLSETAKSGEMSHIGRGIHRGFLGPKMEIRRNMLVDPFIVDDPDLYMNLFEVIRTFKEVKSWKEKSLREIMPNAIQWTLSKYFGNIAAGPNTDLQNREFYIDHTSSDSLPISIKELKGKGFAVCAEKSAAAQNLLTFVGMESELIASGGCRIPEESEEGVHSYLLVHGPKGEMIYDPTNPRLVTDKDGQLTSYSPALYPISEEQSKHLISGKLITVEHVDNKIDENNQIIPDKSNRIYAGPGLK